MEVVKTIKNTISQFAAPTYRNRQTEANEGNKMKKKMKKKSKEIPNIM